MCPRGCILQSIVTQLGFIVERWHVMGVRRQSALVASSDWDGLAAFPFGSNQNTFPECDAGPLNVQSSRFCDHASISFEKRFLNINPQSTPRRGLSGLFPKAYNAPFAQPS